MSYVIAKKDLIVKNFKQQGQNCKKFLNGIFKANTLYVKDYIAVFSIINLRVRKN